MTSAISVSSIIRVRRIEQNMTINTRHERSLKRNVRAPAPLLVAAQGFISFSLYSAAVAAQCPNGALRAEVEAALEVASKLPEEDRDGLERIVDVLRECKRLATEGESLCTVPERRVKTACQKELKRIAKLLARGDAVLEVIAPGVDERAIEAIRIDGEPLPRQNPAAFRLDQGRHSLQVKLDPSAGARGLRVALELDGAKVEPRLASDTMMSFSFETPPRAAVKLVLRLDTRRASSMYVVTHVTRAKSSTEHASVDAIALRLNGAELEAGKPFEIQPGAAELSVAHPPSSEEGWFHVQATLDGGPLEGIDDDPARETYRFAGIEGKTRTVDLAIDSDRWPNPWRPWAIWGGAALAVAGTGIGLWQLIERGDWAGEFDTLQNECDDRRGCEGTPLARDLLSAADQRDAAGNRSGWAFGFGAVGIGALVVGLFVIEPGRPYPDEASRERGWAGLPRTPREALRVLPALAPGGASATVSGWW